MQDASAMYLEAVEVMEDEGQETMALDIFRQAIGQLTFRLPSQIMLYLFLFTVLLAAVRFPVVLCSFLDLPYSVWSLPMHFPFALLPSHWLLLWIALHSDRQAKLELCLVVGAQVLVRAVNQGNNDIVDDDQDNVMCYVTFTEPVMASCL